MKQKCIIIGAGPCGLGAAWELVKLGEEDFSVFESTSIPGGLSSSHTDSFGCTWDIGGHVFHTAIPYAKEVFQQIMHDDDFTYARNAFVTIDHTLIPYPIQLHTDNLPDAFRIQCEQELKHLKQWDTPAPSFYDWIMHSFGKTLADIFFIPYNEKMWTYSLKHMSAPWAQTRIASLTEVAKKNTWGTNEIFSVCRVGGIGTVWNRMAKRLVPHIMYNKKVVKIDADTKRIFFSDGTQVEYTSMLSTMPLTELIAMTTSHTPLPDTERLMSCGIASIGIGIQGPKSADMKTSHWIYVPQRDVPFFRVSVYTNYSNAYAPKGVWTILAEVSYEKHRKPLPHDVLQQTIKGLQMLRYITEKDTIVDTDVVLAPYAYPIPTPERDVIVSRSITALMTYGISSRGRFGSWKYETGNMDHAFMEGVTWAREMKCA